MLRFRVYVSFNILLLIAASCGVKKPAASVSSGPASKLAEDYIRSYGDLAVSEMKRSGVPASITLAQGMIESDYGRSTLARNANNHFGIKCHNGWTGPTVTHHDDRRNECFRKYKRAEDSFYDHSDFLRNGSRYRELFDYNPTDYKAWARGLKKMGYATNPSYDNMLIKSIEENGLWQYDRGYKPEPSPARKEESVPVTTPSVTPRNGIEKQVFAVTPRVNENNRVQYIIVKDGETREKIEKEFGLLRWELPRYNDLGSDFVPVAGQILYLQPKRDKAEAGKDYHIMAEGESVYSVSQKYGVKIKSLYELNSLMQGTEPGPGTRLKLR